MHISPLMSSLENTYHLIHYRCRIASEVVPSALEYCQLKMDGHLLSLKILSLSYVQTLGYRSDSLSILLLLFYRLINRRSDYRIQSYLIENVLIFSTHHVHADRFV